MKFSDRKSSRGSSRSFDSINESAVQWISRRDAGLDVDEEAAFQAWIDADPRHAAAIGALQPAWTKLNQLRHRGRGSDLRVHVEGLVARRKRHRFAIGVSCLAAAAAIAIGLFLPLPGLDPDPLPSSVVVRTNRQFLPDGSAVDLNSGAEIAIEFTSETRGVRLINGEALFTVLKDSKRPFIVSAGYVAVRAVGTAFAVRLEPNAVDVLVTHGRVAVNRTDARGHVSAPGIERSAKSSAASAEEFPAVESTSTLEDSVMVDAGKKVVVPVYTTSLQLLEPSQVTVSEVATALAWRNRRVEFNGTSLATAVEIFNRDNSIQLSVANRETGALRITGTFWTNDPEAFSRAVETSLAVSAKQESGTTITFRK